MKIQTGSACDAPDAVGGYSQLCSVQEAKTLVFVSGQIPVTCDGSVPHGFDAQCRLVWHNIEAQLRAANMTLDNVVKITTFLSDRRYAEANGAIRAEVLGIRAPALTVIIAEIFDPAWLVEIEAVAAA